MVNNYYYTLLMQARHSWYQILSYCQLLHCLIRLVHFVAKTLGVGSGLGDTSSLFVVGVTLIPGSHCISEYILSIRYKV